MYAKYGENLLRSVSAYLTAEFGNGFSVRNLRAMRQFYLLFPIRHALRKELSWTDFFACERHSKSYRTYQSAMLPDFGINFKNLSHFSRVFKEQFGYTTTKTRLKKTCNTCAMNRF
jgi:hypothetical protein